LEHLYLLQQPKGAKLALGHVFPGINMKFNEHHCDREVCSDSAQQIQQAIHPQQATITTFVYNSQARGCSMAVVLLRIATAAVVVVAASIQ
jgi:hypothetical protein